MVTSKRHVHTYILKRVQELRPGWPCTRVSRNALELIERRTVSLIDRMIQSHPSIGKTFLGE